MTVQTAVFGALKGLVGNRCYPNTFMQGANLPTWPAIRYVLTNGEPDATLCGSNAEDEDDIDVQIDIAAETYEAMRLLKIAVLAALQSTDPPCVRQAGGFETYDTETKTHRASLTYLFQASS